MKLIFIILLTTIIGQLQVFKSSSGRPFEWKRISQINADTSYYHVYIGIERGVTEEFIKTYFYKGQRHADIRIEKYLKYTYVNTPTTIHKLDSFELKSIVLGKSQIDTLDNFVQMLKTGTIRYNRIGFSGRIGIYQAIINGDTIKHKSKELYSLTNGLGYGKE